MNLLQDVEDIDYASSFVATGWRLKKQNDRIVWRLNIQCERLGIGDGHLVK